MARSTGGWIEHADDEPRLRTGNGDAPAPRHPPEPRRGRLRGRHHVREAAFTGSTARRGLGGRAILAGGQERAVRHFALGGGYLLPPEAYEEAYDDLIERARDPEPDDAEITVFKDQLHGALRDPSQLPKDALFEAAKYDDGSDEKFLRRLWRDLYGDESVEGSTGD